ncbi:MAG: LytS/YehU family sensor histidine kinase, partial [Crocinitomix sp.]
MLMRRILHNDKLHSVLLSDEIDTITLYLDLEVLRLGERFSYEINCSSLINA